MTIDENLLTKSEKISLSLRKLFSDAGFKRYSMTKFEEYKLYSEHLDFLVSDNVITFTDTNGRLMALKPDITLSIVKNFKNRPEQLSKLYYTENVYRISKGTGSFKELNQIGVECLGDNELVKPVEILTLAGKSLDLISPNNVLSVSHLGILTKVIDYTKKAGFTKGELLTAVKTKSIYSLDSEKCGELIALMKIYGNFEENAEKLKEICETVGAEEEFCEFSEILCANKKCLIDFSLVLDTNYYNGLVMSGYVDGVPESVLSGGCYDRLLESINMKKSAVGFAIYADSLERVFEEN